MIEAYCSYEICKLLKEKGFPQNIETKEIVVTKDCKFLVNSYECHQVPQCRMKYTERNDSN